MIADRKVKKFYMCKVHGKMNKNSDTLNDYLSIRDNGVIIEHKKLNNEFINIITKYTVKQSTNDYSILEVELLTGRKHQIRAHLAFYNHPIFGDKRYGIKDGDRNLELVAYKLIFDFPFEKQEFEISPKL